MARNTLTTITDNGDSSEVIIQGGVVVLEASGGFDSGSLQGKFKPEGGSTFYNIGSALTAAGIVSLGLLPKGTLKFTISGVAGAAATVVPVVNVQELDVRFNSDRGNAFSVTRTNS